MVEVHVTFDNGGLFNVKISYQICLKENSDILVDSHEKWDVFDLKFTSVCSTIQVGKSFDDILETCSAEL